MQLDPTHLPEALRTVVSHELAPLCSLERVVRWAFSRLPPCDVAEVVVQDEFTHDVLIAWNGVDLVFDTT